jgi:hypothetical protein
MLLKDASRTKYERLMTLAITVLEMPTMSIVKSLEPLRGINWNDARPWIAMLGVVILFLGWELRRKRREIQKLDLEIAQMRSQQSLVRVATIHEMNSLIKDVEEISARQLGILGGPKFIRLALWNFGERNLPISVEPRATRNSGKLQMVGLFAGIVRQEIPRRAF